MDKRIIWKILDRSNWEAAVNLLTVHKTINEEEYWTHRLYKKFPPAEVALKPENQSDKDWAYLLEHYPLTAQSLDEALLKEDLLAAEGLWLLDINPNIGSEILFKKNLNRSLTWWIEKEYEVRINIDEYKGRIDPFITWAEVGNEEERGHLFFRLANTDNTYIVYNVLMELAKLKIWPNEEQLNEIMSASRHDLNIWRYVTYLNELEYPFTQSLLNIVCKYLDFELVEKIAIRLEIKPDFNALNWIWSETADDLNRFMDRWQITEVDENLFDSLIANKEIELLEVLAERSILPPAEYVNQVRELEDGDQIKEWFRSKGLLE